MGVVALHMWCSCQWCKKEVGACYACPTCRGCPSPASTCCVRSDGVVEGTGARGAVWKGGGLCIHCHFVTTLVLARPPQAANFKLVRSPDVQQLVVNLLTVVGEAQRGNVG